MADLMFAPAAAAVVDNVLDQQIATWQSSDANQIGERIYAVNPAWRPLAVHDVKSKVLPTNAGGTWVKYLATVLLPGGVESKPGDVRVRKGLNPNKPMLIIEEIAQRSVAKFGITVGKPQYFLHNAQ